MTHSFEQNCFLDYCWKRGKPVGMGKLTPFESAKAPLVYKIISDSYQKHLSIEKYTEGKFNKIIYDSRLLDFRHLHLKEQHGWQKEIVEESSDKIVCLIRNLDDRIILFETYFFEMNLCRRCEMKSPHNVLLAKQEIFYSQLGDPFSGVILFDANGHQVLKKEELIKESAIH